MVVDRFKVRKDLQQRLAESFETTLELSEVLLLSLQWKEMEKKSFFLPILRAHIVDTVCKNSSPDYSHSITPAGACHTCDGLGVQQYFDPQRIVIDDNLSLAKGAIRGWDQKNYYYFQMLSSLAEHFKFALDVPFNSLLE